MKIPLEKKLVKRSQIEIGYLQDEAIEVLYEIFPKAVLRGGTAIWRCYSGNRLSEDIDIYGNNDVSKEEFLKAFQKRALEVLKFKKIPNLIFAKIKGGNVEIRLEINIAASKEGIIERYEKMDGTKIPVFVLPLEELLIEKIMAYKNRRLIRDIYDVFFISTIIEKVKGVDGIKKLLKDLPKPTDEENLKALIFSGPVPTFKKIVEYLRNRWKL